MAKPKRFIKTTRTWRYRGQSKDHTVTSYSPVNPDDQAEADRRNKPVAFDIAEYNAACETGTARIMRFDPPEMVE